MSGKKTEASQKPRKGGFRRTVKRIVVISAVLFLLIFVGIPIYLSSAGGTRLLLGKINSQVDGQIRMDDFSMGWFKGVKLTNLSYDDSIGHTSVTVRRIDSQPKYLSLLGGKIKLGKTRVESPQVYLKVPTAEQPPAVPGTASDATFTPVSAESAPPPVFPVHAIDLELVDGNATVELLGTAAQKVSLSNIVSNVKFDQAGRSGTLDLSMNVDESSSVSASGSVSTDKKGWTVQDGDFDVKISKLQLASLKPLFALAGRDMDVAGQLNAEMTVSVDDNKLKQLKADAVITDLSQGTGSERLQFFQPVTVDAVVTTVDEVIQIETFNVQSQFCDVDCSGTAEKLNFKVDADLAQTQQFAKQFMDAGDLSLAGRFSASGNVAMTDEKTAVNGSGGIKQLQIRKQSVTTSATDVQVEFDGAIDNSKQQLQITSANLTGTPGTVNVNNLIVPLSEGAEKTISMDVQTAIDLEQAWLFAKVFMEDPKIDNVSGQVDAAFNVSTKGSQTRLLTQNSKINNLKFDIPGNEPFLQEKIILNADILLNLEKKTYDIPKLELLGPEGEPLIKVKKGTVEKKVGSEKTEVLGDFEAEYDLQAVSAMTSPFLPEGLSLAGKRNGTLTFNSVYPTDNPEQMIANLNANGAVGFDQLDYVGLHVGPTELQLHVTNGVLDFMIPETTVNEGKLRFAATVDLNAESRVLKLQKATHVLENVHLNEEMTRTLLTRMNPVFADQGDVSGFVNLNCNHLEIPFSEADRKQLFMDAVVSIEDAWLQPKGLVAIILRNNDGKPVPLRLLPTQFVLRDEVVSYEGMEFHLAKYPTGFSGRMSLDGVADMSIALPWKIREEKLGLDSVKIGEDLSKRLEVKCQGSVAELAKCIRYDELLKSAAGDFLEQQIRRGLEDIFK